MTYDDMTVAKKTAKLKAILKGMSDDDAEFIRAHIRNLEIKLEVSRLAHTQLADAICLQKEEG